MLNRNLVIGLLSFLTLIDLFGSQALLPSLKEKYDVDAASMGFAVNASTIGMAVAGLVVALLSRHIDRVKGIWISLALLSIPTFLLGIVDDITLFTVLRVTQGVLMSTAFTLTMAYLAEECSASEAAGAMAAYITGNVASNLLGRLMAANFAEWVGLTGSFWAFSALNLIGAVVASHCLGQTKSKVPVGEQQSPFVVWQRHLSNPGLRAGFMIGFLILFIFLSVFTYVNFVLATEPFRLSASNLGIVYFVFLPAMLTTPVAGRLVAVFGVVPTYLSSMVVTLLGLAATLSSSLTIMLAGLAAIGVGTFCAQAAVSGFVGRAADGDRAAASGLYLASYYLGGLMGALVIGRVFVIAGWTTSITVIAAATALSCLFALRLKIPEPNLNTQRT